MNSKLATTIAFVTSVIFLIIILVWINNYYYYVSEEVTTKKRIKHEIYQIEKLLAICNSTFLDCKTPVEQFIKASSIQGHIKITKDGQYWLDLNLENKKDDRKPISTSQTLQVGFSRYEIDYSKLVTPNTALTVWRSMTFSANDIYRIIADNPSPEVRSKELKKFATYVAIPRSRPALFYTIFVFLIIGLFASYRKRLKTIESNQSFKIRQLQNNNSHLKNDIDFLNDRIKENETTKNQLIAQKIEIENQQLLLEDKDHKIQEHINNFNSTQSKLSVFLQEIQKIVFSKDELSNSNNNFFNAQMVLDKLNSLKSKAEQMHEKLKQAEELDFKLKSELLEEQRLVLESNNSSLIIQNKQLLEEKKVLSQSIDNQNRLITQTEKTANLLEQKLKNEQKNVQDLSSQIMAINDEIINLQSKYELESDLDTLYKKSNSDHDSIDFSERYNVIKQINDSIGFQKSLLENAISQRKYALKQIEDLKNDVAFNKQRYNQLQLEKNNLQNDNTRLTDFVNELKNQQTLLEAEKNQLAKMVENQNIQHNLKIKELNQQHSLHLEKIKNHDATSSSSQELINLENDLINRFTIEIKSKEKELNAQKENFNKNINKLKNELITIKKERELLKASESSKQSEIEKLNHSSNKLFIENYELREKLLNNENTEVKLYQQIERYSHDNNDLIRFASTYLLDKPTIKNKTHPSLKLKVADHHGNKIIKNFYNRITRSNNFLLLKPYISYFTHTDNTRDRKSKITLIRKSHGLDNPHGCYALQIRLKSDHGFTVDIILNVLYSWEAMMIAKVFIIIFPEFKEHELVTNIEDVSENA